MIQFIESILPYVPFALGASLGGALLYLFVPFAFHGKHERTPQKVSQKSSHVVTKSQTINNWGG